MKPKNGIIQDIKFQFSPDYDYLYIRNTDGSITGVPTNQLTDEDKKFIYEELNGQRY